MIVDGGVVGSALSCRLASEPANVPMIEHLRVMTHVMWSVPRGTFVGFSLVLVLARAVRRACKLSSHVITPLTRGFDAISSERLCVLNHERMQHVS